MSRDLSECRKAFANLITHKVTAAPGVDRLVEAFSSTPREHFVGPGPWQFFTSAGYVTSPSDDPACLYQDVLVALDPEHAINNGQPSLHARCLSALDPKIGEDVIHIGAGTGYYSAILAILVGNAGSVTAYELQPELAERAVINLSGHSNATVRAESAAEVSLRPCDIIYVNAGCTGPLDSWLDALRPGGRLLLPLTPDEGFGGMLLVTRREHTNYDASFVCRASFIPCTGARDDETARRIAESFETDSRSVRRLVRDMRPDHSCWLCGPTWWLSTDATPRGR